MNIQRLYNSTFLFFSYAVFILDILIYLSFKENIDRFMTNYMLHGTFIIILVFITEIILWFRFFHKFTKWYENRCSKENTYTGCGEDITIYSLLLPFASLICFLVGLKYNFLILLLSIVLIIPFSMFSNPNVFFVYVCCGYRIYKTDYSDIWLISKRKNMKQKIKLENLIKLNDNFFLER